MKFAKGAYDIRARGRNPLGIQWLVLLVTGFGSISSAQNYTVLYNFSGNVDGVYPVGSLIQSGACLYGLTSSGGKEGGGGTIFSFDTQTNIESILYSFGASGDGVNPEGSLTQYGSTFYGMTGGGGSFDDGTIFSFDPAGDTETVVHSFGGSGDGTFPIGSLIQSGSALYGLTRGTIFGFNVLTNTENTLYKFGSHSGDGSNPQGSLIQSGSNLYGLTSTGGKGNGGALFSFNTTTNTETVLHSFGDQENPPGSLTQSGSILYGSTYESLFAFNVNTSAYSTQLSDFGAPSDDLLLDGSTLYGISNYGGTYDNGTIFSFDTATDAYTILYSFEQTDQVENPGGLLLDGSTLYGTTQGGGTHGDGVIFALSIPEPASTSLLAACGLLTLRRRAPQHASATATGRNTPLDHNFFNSKALHQPLRQWDNFASGLLMKPCDPVNNSL